MDTAPLYTRINPMTITETAAARSPRNLTFKESREADKTCKKKRRNRTQAEGEHRQKSAAEVFRGRRLDDHGPGEHAGQEARKKPQSGLRRRAAGSKERREPTGNKDPGGADRPVVETGRGRTPKSTKPSRIIRMPPVIVRIDRRPEKNGLKLARWVREAAKAPSRPYVKNAAEMKR